MWRLILKRPSLFYNLQLADYNFIITKEILFLPHRRKAFLNHASNALFSFLQKKVEHLNVPPTILFHKTPIIRL